eukprot:35368-Rhodomonas_salina.1
MPGTEAGCAAACLWSETFAGDFHGYLVPSSTRSPIDMLRGSEVGSVWQVRAAALVGLEVPARPPRRRRLHLLHPFQSPHRP